MTRSTREQQQKEQPGRPDRLWTQKEAADHLGVSERYLRASTVPRLLLPGTGPAGKPIVRYDPIAVQRWYMTYTVGAME